MAKKRKSDTSGMEEVEKTLYSSFVAAANSISHLYTQAQNQQRAAFHAGQRHNIDRMHQILMRDRANGATHIHIDRLLEFLKAEQDLTESSTAAVSPLQEWNIPSVPPLMHQQQQFPTSSSTPAALTSSPSIRARHSQSTEVRHHNPLSANQPVPSGLDPQLGGTPVGSPPSMHQPLQGGQFPPRVCPENAECGLGNHGDSSTGAATAVAAAGSTAEGASGNSSRQTGVQGSGNPGFMYGFATEAERYPGPFSGSENSDSSMDTGPR